MAVFIASAIPDYVGRPFNGFGREIAASSRGYGSSNPVAQAAAANEKDKLKAI